MPRLISNLVAAIVGVFVAVGVSACVSNPDGTTRPATPDEAAQIIDNMTPVVAPAAGPYAGIVMAAGAAAGIFLREWGRMSGVKDAAKAKEREDAAWDEAHRLPPPPEVKDDEAPA